MVLRTVSDDNQNLNEFGNLGTRTNVTVYFLDGTQCGKNTQKNIIQILTLQTEIELRRKWFSNKKRTPYCLAIKVLGGPVAFSLFLTDDIPKKCIFVSLIGQFFIIYLWFIGNGRLLFPFNAFDWTLQTIYSGQISAYNNFK